MTAIDPKCASVKGGNLLELSVNIDDLTASYLKHLTVGFQRRVKREEKKELTNISSSIKEVGPGKEADTP